MKALYNGCTFEFDLEGATYTDRELDVATRGAVRRLVEDQHAELTALRAEVERLREDVLRLEQQHAIAKCGFEASQNIVAELRCANERLQERFDAVRDAAHAEAKRVFPAAVVESHFGGELHADDLCSMLATEVERLREERRWIPVTERTPPEYERIILAVAGFESFPGCYSEVTGWFRLVQQQREQAPTHWMPLPEPPREA